MDIVDQEIKERLDKLAPYRSEIVKRVEDIKIGPGEVVTRIRMIDGILVEFARKEVVS